MTLCTSRLVSKQPLVCSCNGYFEEATWNKLLRPKMEYSEYTLEALDNILTSTTDKLREILSHKQYPADVCNHVAKVIIDYVNSHVMNKFKDKIDKMKEKHRVGFDSDDVDEDANKDMVLAYKRGLKDALKYLKQEFARDRAIYSAALEAKEAFDCEVEKCSLCPHCILLYYGDHEGSWFVNSCPRPHVLVWARTKTYGFWPAKLVGLSEDKTKAKVFYFDKEFSCDFTIDVSTDLKFITRSYTKTFQKKDREVKDPEGFQLALRHVRRHINFLEKEYPDIKVYWPEENCNYDGVTLYLAGTALIEEETDDEFEPSDEENDEDRDFIAATDEEEEEEDEKPRVYERGRRLRSTPYRTIKREADDNAFENYGRGKRFRSITNDEDKMPATRDEGESVFKKFGRGQRVKVKSDPENNINLAESSSIHSFSLDDVICLTTVEEVFSTSRRARVPAFLLQEILNDERLQPHVVLVENLAIVKKADLCKRLQGNNGEGDLPSNNVKTFDNVYYDETYEEENIDCNSSLSDPVLADNLIAIPSIIPDDEPSTSKTVPSKKRGRPRKKPSTSHSTPTLNLKQEHVSELTSTPEINNTQSQQLTEDTESTTIKSEVKSEPQEISEHDISPQQHQQDQDLPLPLCDYCKVNRAVAEESDLSDQVRSYYCSEKCREYACL